MFFFQNLHKKFQTVHHLNKFHLGELILTSNTTLGEGVAVNVALPVCAICAFAANYLALTVPHRLNQTEPKKRFKSSGFEEKHFEDGCYHSINKKWNVLKQLNHHNKHVT